MRAGPRQSRALAWRPVRLSLGDNRPGQDAAELRGKPLLSDQRTRTEARSRAPSSSPHSLPPVDREHASGPDIAVHLYSLLGRHVDVGPGSAGPIGADRPSARLPRMAFSVRKTSIRRRLFLLVLALWVPAVAGLALQAYSGYGSQKESLQEEMQQQGMALRFGIDTEIDRRLTLARALAALPSLEARDLATFERAARAAVKGSAERVLLLDREQQYFNTGAPASAVLPRHPGSLFVTSGMGIFYAAKGPLTQEPTMAVLVPESGRTPPQYNVGVPFPPARVQELIQAQRLRAATVVSVIDSQQRVMGRSRDPARWIGQRASHPALLDMAVRGDSGFLETRTLDNVASLTYVSPPGRYGWAVVALPELALTNAAWAIALRAVASSAVLLLIGLGLAILAARVRTLFHDQARGRRDGPGALHYRGPSRRARRLRRGAIAGAGLSRGGRWPCLASRTGRGAAFAVEVVLE